MRGAAGRRHLFRADPERCGTTWWCRPRLFVFDLLYLDGRNLMPLPVAQRKADLAALLESRDGAIRFSDHQIGQGPAFHQHACALGLEGIVSKRLDAPYVPGDRGL
jgi:ATP-dependent DNA ligase